MNDQDRAILAFAKQTWRNLGARESAIREQFGMSPTRFAQRLDRILDMPDAYLLEPMLVKRLRRLRESRARERRAG